MGREMHVGWWWQQTSWDGGWMCLCCKESLLSGCLEGRLDLVAIIKKKKKVASLSSRLSFSYILIYGYK